MQEDMESLWSWRNSPQYLRYCSCRREAISLEEFKLELERDFSCDRHEQYMICKRKTEEPIGTIFSYNYNFVDGYTFVTTFLSYGNEGSGRGVEAFLLFVVHLFEAYELHKVYTEVYEYNQLSLRTMLNGGLVEEGRFKEHRLFEERRWDLIRLAAFRHDLPRARNLVLRLGGKEKE